MDIAKVKNLRRKLTLHFAIIAWLTTMLVATGSGTSFLPVFIFCVSCAAFIFVDTLEWFEVGRIGSYILMSIATIIAVSNYVYSAFYAVSEQGQLLAVAGLLVYPEAVLFLQRKCLRVFEQLAVFLLLEMIVAALVNDNIIFAALLAPIMLLWVSSLFLFARYATLVHLDPSIEQPIPHLAELIYKKFKKSIGVRPAEPYVRTAPVADRRVQGSRLLRRLLQSVPLGVAAIAFAAFFFYLMPRTTTGSLRTSLTPQSAQGLPNRLTIGLVGRLKQDNSPVMRVSLRTADGDKPYKVALPPYIRARVMDSYLGSGSQQLSQKGQWMFNGLAQPRKLPSMDAARELKRRGRDLLHVEFDIRRIFLPTLGSLTSCYEPGREQRLRLRYDKFNMLLEEVSPTEAPNGKSIVYHLATSGFAKGQQLPVVPVDIGNSERERNAAGRNHQRMFGSFMGFTGVDAYRRDILKNAGCSEDELYRAARLYENHLGASGRFTYTLDLGLQEDPSLDPIEDFILNSRKGHCQYFASAQLAMMRQHGIPGRIVVGYRPVEFNKHGEYFAVKQSDAHAWVEGFFTREQLEGTELERWLTDQDFYWVRFDPTPSAEGALDIVEQEGQTLDYAEKLWKDYVVDAQKLSDQNSIYAPVAANGKDAFDNLIRNFAFLRDGFQGRDIFSGGVGFAWPLAIIIFAFGALLVLMWKAGRWLPKLAPRLARRLGVGKATVDFHQSYFSRCMQLLEAAGFSRSADQTPLEFTKASGRDLASRSTVGADSVEDSLAVLTEQYYRDRFSEARASSASPLIADALASVEKAVKPNRK